MSELWEDALHDYESGMKYKEIAEKYSVSLNTVKSWKTRHWNKKGVHTKKECAHKKKGAQPGNKNSKGGPPGNQKAKKHGLFASGFRKKSIRSLARCRKILWISCGITFSYN